MTEVGPADPNARPCAVCREPCGFARDENGELEFFAGMPLFRCYACGTDFTEQIVRGEVIL